VLVGGLKRDHGQAVNSALAFLAGLDWTAPTGSCLRSVNQNAVRISHPRGTFRFAFLSLEFEIKAMIEVLSCPGLMKQRPEQQR
jgi:hypothetical protein